MKRLLFVIFLCLNIFQYGNSHGFGVHAAHYARILALNDQYKALIENPRYKPYFIYGAMFPDIQYANNFKSTLANLYSEVRNKKVAGVKIFKGLTYEIKLDEIPDPDQNHPVFGFDTHDEQYGIEFAEYLLVKSENRLPGVMVMGNPIDLGSDQVNKQIAFALGYYMHLATDIACHNFLIPKVTALLNLGDLQVIKNPSTFTLDPNAQMEGFIEGIADYYYGDYNLVKQTVFNDIYVAIGQLEPPVPMVIYDGTYIYTNSQYLGLANPIFNFYLTAVRDFLAINPAAKKNDPISIGGLIELVHVFRFANRFYPEAVGHGRIDEALATWISNHYDFCDGVEVARIILGLGSAGLLQIALDVVVEKKVYKGALESVAPKLTGDARSLLSLMLSNMSMADNLVINNPGEIDANEYNRLKSSLLFTNPTGFLNSMINEYMDLGTYIYRWIGPSPPDPGNPDGRRWYADWSPWHNQSMRWGALSSLNNLMPSNYKSHPDVAVYDAYFTIGGQRVTGLVPCNI